MIPRRLLRWWSMAWELGLVYALLFIGIAAFHLQISLGINRAFPPGHFNQQQVFYQYLLFFMMWSTVCGRHLRLLASAAQLQVPGTVRPLCLSLAGLALLGGGWFITSMSLLHEPRQQMWVVLVDTVLLALLQQSSRGYRSALWILIWALLMMINMGWRPFTPFTPFVPASRPGWSPTAVLILFTIWLFRSNRPAKLPDQAGSWWRSFPFTPQQRDFSASLGQPGPRGLVRVALGPAYRPGRLLSLPMLLSSLLVAAFPWLIARIVGIWCAGATLAAAQLEILKPQMILLMGMANLLLWPLVMFAGVLHLAHLGAVLKRHGGEFVELALVPGMGNGDARRRLLLQEALLRPLAWYVLWNAGLTGSMLGFAALIHARWNEYLYLLLQGCAWPFAFAAIGWGLLCGALDPARPWLGKAWLPALLLSIITNSEVILSESSGQPDPLDGFPLWLCLTWAALLLLLTIGLLRWAWVYAGRQNPYCR
jgi:hypothetical protein